jgi:hypothetical protein
VGDLILAFATFKESDQDFRQTYIKLTAFSVLSYGSILGASVALNEGEKNAIFVYIKDTMGSLLVWFVYHCLCTQY